MMEFTLSRVVMSVCALMLLAALGPLLHSHAESRMDGEAESIAESFDGLLLSVSRSGGSMVLDCSRFLPSEEWTMVLDEGRVTVSDGERSHLRPLEANYGGGRLELDSGSAVRISAGPEGEVHLQKVEAVSCNASASLSTSSWSL